MLRLNCDLGENFGNWQLVDERQVMPFIHMANVACGYHAGDPVTIRQTLKLAAEFGVQVGAHPSYPDLMGFGRRSMRCSSEEITAFVLYQVGALRELARAEGVAVEYVKPHGALYNDMMVQESVLRAILAALQISGLPLMLMATPDNERFAAIAEEYQVAVIFEAFADRRYTAEGRLQARTEAGAVLHDAEEIAQQVRALCDGRVVSAAGEEIALAADSLCVHGDNPESIAVVRQIRALIDAERR